MNVLVIQATLQNIDPEVVGCSSVDPSGNLELGLIGLLGLRLVLGLMLGIVLK